MKLFIALIVSTTLIGCDQTTSQFSTDISETQLDAFFRSKTVAGNHAAAIKLRFTVPQAGVSYLGTIHGYPNNLSVCEELIAPYNEDPSLTTIPGASYFCEVLR